MEEHESNREATGRRSHQSRHCPAFLEIFLSPLVRNGIFSVHARDLHNLEPSIPSWWQVVAHMWTFKIGNRGWAARSPSFRIE
jgi:hypothetical protein